MTDVTYTGGRSFIVLTSEQSQSDLDNYGATATATAERGLWATNFTNPRKNNQIRVYSIGNGRSFVASIPGKYEVSGNLEFELQGIGHLKYALGSLSTATATTDLDGNAITSATTLVRYKIAEANVLDSFNIDQYHISDNSTADLQIKYKGCKVNQMTIKADTDNPLHCTFDWVGQSELISSETASTPSLTALADTPPMFYRGNLFMGGTVDHTTTPGSISNPTTACHCNSVDITLVNNIEPYFSICAANGRGMKFAIEKMREYTLKLDLNFTNTDMLRRFYDGTTSTSNSAPLTTSDYTPFAVSLDYKTGTVGVSSNSFKQMRIIMEKVYFDETSIPVNPKDIIKQDVSAFAKTMTVYSISNEVS